MKERLKRYARLLCEIDVEERRLLALAQNKGYWADVTREGILRHLKELEKRERAENEALSGILKALPKAEQRQVIMARYFDGHSWAEVARVLFGRHADFYDKLESYQRRVYRIHGLALTNANKIANEGKNG